MSAFRVIFAALLLCSTVLWAASNSGRKAKGGLTEAEYEAQLKQSLAARLDTNRPSAAAAAPASGASAGTSNAAPAIALGSMESLDDKHRLVIGDKVSFRILEDLEDPAEPLEPKALVVTDSGELEVPYLGRFPAEQKTCKQLAYELKAALEKDYYYQATVIIAVDLMAKTRGRIYVNGPVRFPGPQEIPSDEVLTLSKAIMRAGGFSDFADRQHVKVTRKHASGAAEKRPPLSVDVGLILDKGRTDLDLPLESGDVIQVSERVFRY